MYSLFLNKYYFSYFNNIIFCRKIWFYDEIGNQYLDSSSGPMTSNIGYCPELFLNFYINKLVRINFSYRFQFINYDYEFLSKKIIDLNKNKKSKCFFLNSGSESSEASIRIAIDYFYVRRLFYKKHIIGRYITNHGNTFLSLNYGDDSYRKKNYSNIDLNPEFFNIKIIQCYCFQCPLNLFYKTCKFQCIQYSFFILNSFGIEKISSVILEPITASSGGVLIPPKHYFKFLKYKLKKNNILLISDEIVNAFLRIGGWFISNVYDLDSDISIIGKGLGSGFYPISGIVISDFILKVLYFQNNKISIGHTYSGNAFSVGIALNIINFLENNINLYNIIIKSKFIREIINFLFKKMLFFSNLRIKGFLCSIETTLNNKILRYLVFVGYYFGISLYFCRSSGRNRDILTFLITPQFVINEIDILYIMMKVFYILYIIFY